MTALINTAPLPDDPGCTAYQITGFAYDDVQSAMLDIMERAPEAHFRPIKREYSIHDGLKCWRTRGFTREDA